MYRPIVSIVIPIYNTTSSLLDRLFECLSCLANKSEFEIVFVDDGSNNELTISEEQKFTGNNVKLIKIEHRGVSAARNVGINNSNGDYIMFVDADDAINSEMLINFINSNKNLSDITFFEMNIVPTDYTLNARKGYSIYKPDDINSFKNIVVRDYVVLDGHDFSIRSCWGKLFKKTILSSNKILFDEDLSFYEDYLFMDMVFNKILTYTLVLGEFYFYRTNPISSSRKIDINFFDKFNKFYAKYNELFSKEEDLMLLLSKTILKHVMITRVIIGLKNKKINYSLKSLKQVYIKNSFCCIWKNIDYKKTHFNDRLYDSIKNCIEHRLYLISVLFIVLLVLRNKKRI